MLQTLTNDSTKQYAGDPTRKLANDRWAHKLYYDEVAAYNKKIAESLTQHHVENGDTSSVPN